MKFIGSAKRLRSSVFYSVEDDNGCHLCGDVCEAIITDEQYQDDDLIVAFGYDGRAPDRLSSGMLYWTLGEFEDVWQFNDAIVFAFDPKTDMRVRYLKHRPMVMRLYRKFTQQITSKLPDNWEMTTDEINAWIKDHKQLPACIRNQTKTKGKKYGKAETKERESSVV